nr:MAG TPA: hypothetical protein [Caudoviricetes sp.]
MRSVSSLCILPPLSAYSVLLFLCSVPYFSLSMPVGIRRFWILWFCKVLTFLLLFGCRVYTYIVNWVVYGNMVICHFTIGVVFGFLIFRELRGVSCPGNDPPQTPAPGYKLPDLCALASYQPPPDLPEFVKVKENEPQNTDFIIFLCPPHPLPGLSLRFLLVNVAQCPPLSVTPAPVCLHSDLFSAPPGCNRDYY